MTLPRSLQQPAAPMPASRVGVSARQKAFRMLWASKTGLLGLVITLLISVIALFADVLSPRDPMAQDVTQRLIGPVWSTGNTAYLLGTDALGRDLLSRMIYGARISLLVGIVAVVISGAVGVALGLVAGYFGGGWDSTIMRLADIQLAVPTMVLALALVAVLGSSVTNVILVLGVTGWVVYARVARGEVLALREKEFVESARALGAGHARILLWHILPNIASSIVVISSLRVAAMIPLEATLSFLGLGIPPPTPTWGAMVSEGRTLIFRAWWVTTFPGLAIVTIVLGINLLGDWLRDVLDPRLRS